MEIYSNLKQKRNHHYKKTIFFNGIKHSAFLVRINPVDEILGQRINRDKSKGEMQGEIWPDSTFKGMFTAIGRQKWHGRLFSPSRILFLFFQNFRSCPSLFVENQKIYSIPPSESVLKSGAGDPPVLISLNDPLEEVAYLINSMRSQLNQKWRVIFFFFLQ